MPPPHPAPGDTRAVVTGAGFVRTHLNGNYALARSYWIHLVAIQAIFVLAAKALVDWMDDHFPAQYSSSATIVLIPLGYVVWAWAASGTWASSNRHVSRGGRRGWALTAKVMIVLGGVQVLSSVPANLRGISSHWEVASGVQWGPQPAMEVIADGQAIVFDGGINDGSAEALAAALDRAPRVTTVIFRSAGGWAREGRLIAAVVATRGMDTQVDTECSSACTIAFLAGKVRLAPAGAKLGFHAFSTVDGRNAGIEPVRQAYAGAGLTDAFMAKIVATPAGSMWYPDHDELVAQGILTRRLRGAGSRAAPGTGHSRL